MLSIQNPLFEDGVTIRNSDRFNESHATHVPSRKKAKVYHFQLNKNQDYHLAWNDFYIYIDLLKKIQALGQLHLLEYGELKIDPSLGHPSVFYYAVELPNAMKAWDEWAGGSAAQPFAERFQVWLSLAKLIGNVHRSSLHHGVLSPKHIQIFENNDPRANPVEVLSVTYLLYKAQQIFLLAEDPSSYSDLHPGGRYLNRGEADDRYSLGVLLFALIFPNEPVPRGAEALFAYQSRCDQELYNILYCLLSLDEEFHLASAISMAETYIEGQFSSIAISVGWSEHSSALFQGGTGIVDWENRFIADTEQESFLFTVFDKSLMETLLVVVGRDFEWTLVMKRKNARQSLTILQCKEIDILTRERLKERGQRFRGTWQFQSAMSSSAGTFLNLVRDQSLGQRQESKTRLRTRDTTRMWEEYLKLQQGQQMHDDLRFAYQRWTLLEGGAAIGFELLSTAAQSVPFQPGVELVVTDDQTQNKVGRFIRFEGSTVVVEASQYLNTEMLPSLGDIMEDQTQQNSLIRRQRQALQRFKYGEQGSKPVIRALVDPKGIGEQFPAGFVQAFQELNEKQELALRAALGTDSVFLLQGPPGTGKTTWIAELIMQIFRREPKARVLLSSQSNVAIDHAFVKVISQMTEHRHSFRAMPQFVRLGNDKISENALAWKLETAVAKWADDMEEQINDNIWHLLENSEPERAMRLTSLFNEWKDRIKKHDEIKSVYLAQQPLLAGATCAGSHSFIGWKQNFDWVIIDEAGRATPPETLIPALLGSKVVFVGDHKQLPPVIDQLIESGKRFDRKLLETSLFEELFAELPLSVKHTLTMQYRMHPVISDLVSRLFYAETPLESGCGESDRASGIDWLQPLLWVSTDGRDRSEERNSETSSSFWNEAEVTLIQELLLKLEKECGALRNPKSVAVITGYSLQKQKLAQAVGLLELPHLLVEVDTVDAFQGREADVVMYSLVRNNRDQKVGFLKDERRMNVTLSRAKESVILVGSAAMAAGLPDHQSLRKLYNEFRRLDCSVRSWKEVLA